jgi:hypothetical protein
MADGHYYESCGDQSPRTARYELTMRVEEAGLWRITGKAGDDDGSSSIEGHYNPANGRCEMPCIRTCSCCSF